MKSQTIDFADIKRRQAEHDEDIRLKKELRLENKRRYRPRGQINKEKAERRSAAAVLNTTKHTYDEAIEDDNNEQQRESSTETEGPQSKKTKVDFATKGAAQI